MKFLVINFDRYDTEESTREYYEASSVEDVISQKAVKDSHTDENVEELKDYMLSELTKVDEVYSCISGDESDILFYVI